VIKLQVICIPLANQINPSTYRGGFWGGISSFLSGFPWLGKGSDLTSFHNEIINNDVSYHLSNTKKLIQAGFLTNPHIFAVVNKILVEIINIPWYVYDVEDKAKMQRLKALKNAKNFDAVLNIDKATYEISEGKEPLNNLLIRPNSKQTWEQMIQAMAGMYILTGECFNYGIKSDLRVKPGLLEFIPLPSQLMSVIPNGQWTGEVANYLLHLAPDKAIDFSTPEILHIKNFNPELSSTIVGSSAVYTLGMRGLSNLVSLGRPIQASNDGFIAQMKLLQNGGPIGILSNASNEPLILADASESTTVVNDQMADYSGAHNKGKIRLTSANLKWISMGMNSVDLQLLELQKSTLASVCNVLNMPLEMMSLDGSTFNNKDSALKEMWNGAILPILNILRDNINTYLAEFYPTLKAGTQWIDYDHRAIPALQKDIDKMHKIWLERVQNHLATPEMYQEAMGIDNVTPDENLSKYFTTTNLRRADEPLPGRTDVNNNGNSNDPAGT
jgi:phage portal protein BeeE